MSLHTWGCQGPRKPSSCSTFMLNPHWGRAARLCMQGRFSHVQLFATLWTMACRLLCQGSGNKTTIETQGQCG